MRLRSLVWLAPLGLVLLLAACSRGTDDTSETTLAPASTVVETTTTTSAPTASTTVAATQVSGSLALVNGTLVDGTGAAPVADAVVVIDGERIVAVGARDRLSVSPDTPTVDVQGATLLPGFINAHVHMAYDRERLAAWAQSGVTTVRDLGTALWQAARDDPPPPDLCPTGCRTPSEVFVFRDEVSGDPSYARLVAAGPIVFGPRQPASARPAWLHVASPEEAKSTVGALVDDGADLVKVYIVEETPDDALTHETVAAIVEVAHSRGVPVSAHVLRSVHLPYALEAGADDLAHMVKNELDGDLLDRVVGDDVYWVPTLEVWNCSGELHAATVNLRRFVQAGGHVALGTDYHDFERHPDFTPYGCPFDLGMPMTEIELMAEAEMTPMQIIVAATSNGAHVCGLEDQIGRLEAGKIADILVVAGDPLEDLQALTDVQMVVHNGVVIRDEISAGE